MADYLDKMNEQEEPSIVQEPVIQNGMPLHEGCDLLRARIEKKMYEKNRVQEFKVL